MEENIAVQVNETMASTVEARPAQDFDALLRERDFQSEFDRRVSRALETARGKWARETEQKIQHAREEAEARARMSGEERMAHDFAQRQAALEERERNILQRELRADAARILQERGLPAELAGAVNYQSAESVQASLDAAETAFRAAVQLGVEQRMRGSAPGAARRQETNEISDADYYRARAMPGRKQN